MTALRYIVKAVRQRLRPDGHGARFAWSDAPGYAASLRVPGANYAGCATFEHHVFICGLHRSGTTILERYLTSRFRVCHLRALTPESEGQHMQGVYPAASLHGGPGRFAFHPEMLMPVPDADSGRDLRRRLLADWSNFTIGEEPILVEKSPPNLTKIDWLRAVFPGARFLVLTRDPRVVAAATLKWSRQSFEEAIFHWNVAHSIALDQVRSTDCTLIRYEDFCRDPDAVLDAAANLADLPRRETPLPLGERFERIADANASYLDALPPRSLGHGAWDDLGYRL